MPVDVINRVNHSMWLVGLPLQQHFNKGFGDWRPIEGYIDCSYLTLQESRLASDSVWVARYAQNPVALSSGHTASLPFGAVIRSSDVSSDESPDALRFTMLDGQKATILLDNVCNIPSVVEDISFLKRALWCDAKEFIDMPYCWGGCSVWLGVDCPTPSSVDCSGLIYLLMHKLGLAIPRNSGDQILFATEIEPCDAACGDIFFLEPLEPGIPKHILMYLGDDIVIEASGLSGPAPKVCTSSVCERFGLSLHELSNGGELFTGDPVKKPCRLYCGSFFTDPVKLQSMRDNFLANV
jgi:hypothetical protein